ncbi:aminodeoxychorismate lyase [Zafaria sp. Z1313]|uniref:aminodeoxychorismate lyase n=1 Tax=unclassified Zafaria TaxID=2828765 RepID=UPI002E79F5D3|nr:aminodeoxychorismate lyase [Zafaria sp. J156]MEE1622329.1 aminodeoxychorismate lyase [Zafaria sp. J156]
MTVVVFLEPGFPAGRVADASVPQLSVLDQGATRGDGVFESALYVRGRVRKLDAHLARMAVSAATCELPLPAEDAWRAAIATAVAAYDAALATESGDDAGHEAVVKLVATRGPEGAGHGTAWVAVSPAPELGRRQRAEGVDVLLLDRGYDSTVAERAPWLLMGAKTLSYAVNMAALRHARKQGADDVIFVSSDGRVLEGPTSTVLLAVRDGDVKRLITPMLETGILPGTTQGALFAAAEAAGWELGYGPLEPQHLVEADAVWLVSSVRLLAPVNSLDGVELSRDPELTAELTSFVDAIG